MPALPADIAAATREVTVVTWSSADVAARYPSARDGSLQPAEGFFDSAADAQAVINARGALIGVDRRRFAAAMMGAHWPDVAVLPADRLIDAELRIDATLACARIELDLEAERTSHETWG